MNTLMKMLIKSESDSKKIAIGFCVIFGKESIFYEKY